MGRTTTESRRANRKERLASKKEHVDEKTTPTRKLEFGHESGVFGESLLTQRSWEKDIAEHLASHSCESLRRGSLVESRLDRALVESRKGLKDDVSLKKLSVFEGAITSADGQQGTPLQDNEADNKKEQNNNGNSFFLDKPHSFFPFGAVADEEEEEEQVLIGKDIVYHNTHNLILPESDGVSPLLERGASTPCLFSTQDGHSCRNQQASQLTADCVPTLTPQEATQRQNANIASIRKWNGQTQKITETVASTGEGTFSEMMEGSPMENTVPYMELAEAPLHHFQRNSMKSRKAWGAGEKGRAATLMKASAHQLAERCHENEAEEDAPFFQGFLCTRLQPALKGKPRGKSHSRPHYAAGMRVEGRWGRGWFGAVVTEDEKNGYVQVRWDDDGSLLHLKVQEVRLPRKKNGSCVEGEEKPPLTSSLMTASQLVDLVKSETPPKAMETQNREGVGCTETKNLVKTSILLLHVTSAVLNYSAKARLILDKLVKHGAWVVVDSPLGLDNQQLTKDKQEPPRVSFFVVTDDDAKKDGGIIIIMAHAVGISAVSVEWLERLEVGEIKECEDLLFPMAEDLVGQGGDAFIRWHWLQRDERLLSNKRIYLLEENADIALLLTLCGGTVTKEAPLDAVLPLHYVYVEAGTRAQIPLNATSIALLEKSWLVSRIEEFFHALPLLRQGIESNGVVHQSHVVGSAFGIKRPREVGEASKKIRRDEEGDMLRATGTVISSLPIHGSSEMAGVEFFPGRDSPDVLVGEDYYFRITQPRNGRREAPLVNLGRVIHVGEDGLVVMRLYEVKYTFMRQNPRTGCVENQTSVYLGSQTVQVFAKDLIFGTPVYVIEAAQMRHVYTLESPPRGLALGAGYDEGNDAEDNKS